MIKCNLAVLMAQRELKIAEISEDTGISRTTLTALYYNQGKGVQFETMDTLCDYLNVSPGQLFSQIEFHAEVVGIDDTLAPNYIFTFEFDVGDEPFEEDIKVQFGKTKDGKLEIDLIVHKHTYDRLMMVPKIILEYELTKLLKPTADTFPESEKGVSARMFID